MKTYMSVALWFTTLIAVSAIGCNGGSHAKREGARVIEVKKTYQGSYPIKVVCTTGMVADLVRNVGGPQVQVEQLLGADVDPHTHQAGAEDVSKLNQAELVF